MYQNFPNITIFDHPLITHKLSVLRQQETGPKLFRELVNEIAMLMGFEAMRDLPTESVHIKTPLMETDVKMIAGKKLALVPILRAGLGMLDGVLALVPSAKIGHIGLYRDHETLEPHEYYCKLPEDIQNRQVILLDPMLATGGSASAAIDFIKKRGCTNIKFMAILAAPEGLTRLSKDHPDVPVFCAGVDERLNEYGYILPGLGDAGDRLFGTL